MPNVWTHGVWSVKPGKEDEFIRGWREMAQIAMREIDVVTRPTFLRDRDRPNVFVSFGPWRSIEDIERFRSSPSFLGRVAAMDELIEGFETRTLDEVGLGE